VCDRRTDRQNYDSQVLASIAASRGKNSLIVGLALTKSCAYQPLTDGSGFLVHGQVTIIFIVCVGLSVSLSVCLFVQSFSQPSLIRFRSTRTYVVCLGLVVSPRI